MFGIRLVYPTGLPDRSGKRHHSRIGTARAVWHLIGDATPLELFVLTSNFMAR
jgi:hypothetical protein